MKQMILGRVLALLMVAAIAFLVNLVFDQWMLTLMVTWFVSVFTAIVVVRFIK